MRFALAALAAALLATMPTHAQGKGDPRLDDLARKWESQQKQLLDMNARLAAIEARLNPGPPVYPQAVSQNESGVPVNPTQASPVETQIQVKDKRNKTVVKVRTTTPDFEEVNRHRARRGLRPFLFDEGLTRAAEKCASIKAQSCHSGHLNGPMSDFSCLEPGVQCAATGADGSKILPGQGWFTCCTEDNYTYAGAGSAIGPDGFRYMSLFVR